MKSARWATDHRAVVLESIATSPAPATVETIIRDCVGPDFDRVKIGKMIWQLRAEGLIGLGDDPRGYFITAAGLDYLTRGRFDRALPCEHTRPRARGRKRKPRA